MQERCKQLFNILTGILRGKPLRLLRQTSERNGFEVWRKLVQLFSPKTKSRSISLLAALMNIPAFSLKDKTLMDQILGLERLRTEYMRSSGTDVADDLMLSILVKSLPKALQTHIQLQMTEHSTYAQVRELVLSYESVTTTCETQVEFIVNLAFCYPALLLLVRTMALLLWRLPGLKRARKA